MLLVDFYLIYGKERISIEVFGYGLKTFETHSSTSAMQVYWKTILLLFQIMSFFQEKRAQVSFKKYKTQ